MSQTINPTIAYQMPWSRAENFEPRQLVDREWLVTNGLSGYASGTVSGIATRRYHGLLVASLLAPLGRMMMFNHIVEYVRQPDGSMLPLAGDLAGITDDAGAIANNLASFSLELGLPVWRYEFENYVLEKRLVMPHRANTVHLIYRLLEGPAPLRLRLRPGLHFRPHEAGVGTPDAASYSVRTIENRVEVTTSDQLSLKLQLREHEAALVLDGGKLYDIEYSHERQRGYPSRDSLWSPGYFRLELEPGASATLSASTETWESLLAVSPSDALETEFERRRRLIAQADGRAHEGTPAALVLAADQFIIVPASRFADEARARAVGDETRSVIAGYHWFTDWGRDTMISLEGLTLVTGRFAEAGQILRTFAHYVRDGLIPNLFPEGEQQGLYHTADATLWYFHALDRYLQYTHDDAILRILLPTLRDIVNHHIEGTRFGIGVDPQDGLLRQGAEGYQLTWMDAKVDDWVVTPRRGKAVEINALWYNALRLLAGWLRTDGDTAAADALGKQADRTSQSFNARFWCGDRGWLFDVIDGEGPDDCSLRPNQIFAISLANPVLAENRWPDVLNVVTEQLLTPLGLRSLGPAEPEYKSHYDGDLRARDAAYHQGTVWSWLIGAFIDAYLRVHPDQVAQARQYLQGFPPHFAQACIGSISEIFDATPPYKPRGCISQAWSVAEVLRSWVNTEPATVAPN